MGIIKTKNEFVKEIENIRDRPGYYKRIRISCIL